MLLRCYQTSALSTRDERQSISLTRNVSGLLVPHLNGATIWSCRSRRGDAEHDTLSQAIAFKKEAVGRLILADRDYATWHMSGVKGFHSDCAPEHAGTSIPAAPKITDKSILKLLARVLYSTSERLASSASNRLGVRYLTAPSREKTRLLAYGRGGRAMDSTIE